MNLTKHFNLQEMTASVTARKFGIDNAAPTPVIENLKILCTMLERVRLLLGHPISVSSGYRSPALNRAVGGARSSAHLEGLAADFTCQKFGNPYQICKKIQQSDIEFQQLILEGAWIHIAAPRAGAIADRQVFTAHFDEKKVRYSFGLIK